MAEQREIVWRQALPGEERPARPSSSAEARARLETGNADFAKLGDQGGQQVISVGPEAFGLPPVDGAGLAQEPFAAVLACSDARAPVELLFNQAGNSIFVVRVAGNVPGRECLGSLNYAVANLPSVKMITVLGHTSCGAVSAAVDALLSPQVYLDVIHDPSLRAIVDALLAGVRMADQALVNHLRPRHPRRGGVPGRPRRPGRHRQRRDHRRRAGPGDRLRGDLRRLQPRQPHGRDDRARRLGGRAARAAGR